MPLTSFLSIRLWNIFFLQRQINQLLNISLMIEIRKLKIMFSKIEKIISIIWLVKQATNQELLLFIFLQTDCTQHFKSEFGLYEL